MKPVYEFSDWSLPAGWAEEETRAIDPTTLGTPDLRSLYTLRVSDSGRWIRSRVGHDQTYQRRDDSNDKKCTAYSNVSNITHATEHVAGENHSETGRG